MFNEERPGRSCPPLARTGSRPAGGGWPSRASSSPQHASPSSSREKWWSAVRKGAPGHVPKGSWRRARGWRYYHLRVLRRRAPLALPCRLVYLLLPAHDADTVPLTEAEHRSLFLYCRDHVVATHCGEEFRFVELAAEFTGFEFSRAVSGPAIRIDLMAREEVLCPRCRMRLVEQVRV